MEIKGHVKDGRDERDDDADDIDDLQGGQIAKANAAREGEGENMKPSLYHAPGTRRRGSAAF